MGNRAVITTPYNYEHNGVAIYLHWNGGRDSVEAFLSYCREKHYRDFEMDESYAFARLIQTIANYFEGGLSIGVGTVESYGLKEQCFLDNGIYLVDGNFEIVGRKDFEGPEQNDYPLVDMVRDINTSQPKETQIHDGVFADRQEDK